VLTWSPAGETGGEATSQDGKGELVEIRLGPSSYPLSLLREETCFGSLELVFIIPRGGFWFSGPGINPRLEVGEYPDAIGSGVEFPHLDIRIVGSLEFLPLHQGIEIRES